MKSQMFLTARPQALLSDQPSSRKRQRNARELRLERLEDRLCLTALHDFDIIAQTGQAGLTGITGSPSINDSGRVAFVGTVSGGESIFVGSGGASLVNITSGLVSSSRSFRPELQINNSNLVGAIDRSSTGGTFTNARIWDTNGSGPAYPYTMIAQGASPNSFNNYFDILASTTSIANDGQLAFAGFETYDGFPESSSDTDWEVHLSNSFVDSRDAISDPFPPFGSNVTNLPSGTFFRQKAASNNQVLVSSRNGSTTSIVLYDITGIDTSTTIASTGPTWSELGVLGGISDDGQNVAFYGNLTAAGATSLGTTSGPGIFASINTGSGRVIKRVAGVAGNNVLDPGERFIDSNHNGTFDSGETEIGPASFDVDGSIGINGTQATDRSVMIVYRAFDAPGGGGNQGIYVNRLDYFGGAGPLPKDPFDPQNPGSFRVNLSTVIVASGETIGGLAGTVQSVSINDPINNTGQVAIRVVTTATQAIVRTSAIPQTAPPQQSQVNSNWSNNVYANGAINPATGQPNTVVQKGCALTSLSMALNYAGISTDPGALNTLLQGTGGFAGSSVNWATATSIAANHAGAPNVSWNSVVTASPTVLKDTLRTSKVPVIVGVNGNTHFVLVTGISGDDFTILDPGHASRTTLASYSNTFQSRGYVADPVDVSQLNVGLESSNPSLDLLVQDPAGNTTGIDPVTGIAQGSIPQSVQFTDSIEDDLGSATSSAIARFVYVFQPGAGNYTLKIGGGAAPTPFLAVSNVVVPSGGVLPQAIYSGTTNPPTVSTFSTSVAGGGDYNQNHTVDAADFVLWRKTLGVTGVPALSGADGDGDTTVDNDDYDIWRSHFGELVPAPASGTSESAADLPSDPRINSPVEVGASLGERSAAIAPLVFIPMTSTAYAPTKPPMHRHQTVNAPNASPAFRDHAILAWLESRTNHQEQQQKTVGRLVNLPAELSTTDPTSLDLLDVIFASPVI